MLLHTKKYLEEMNANIDDKLNIIQYIKGKNVLDVGCGGGGLTKVLNDNGFNAYGLDLSDQAKAQMNLNGLRNKFIQGDAREIHKLVDYGEIDTIIFSSTLHEVYSYNNFSIEAVEDAFLSAFDILPKGGRIIIRDGVMTDSEEKRMITFKDQRDAEIFRKYQNDFKGREIKCEWKGSDKILLDINDAMEFLYTYTWGKESYEREVQEQYGIMTPYEYLGFIETILGGKKYHDILSFNHYLQEGYNYHLRKKIDFTTEHGNIAKLPDSTLLMVIRKNID